MDNLKSIKNEAKVSIYLKQKIKETDEQIKELKKLKEKYIDTLHTSNEYIIKELQNQDITELKTEDLKLSITKSVYVNVLDEDKIHYKYKTINVIEKIDKIQLRKDLKCEKIEGAELGVNNKLQIKTK